MGAGKKPKVSVCVVTYNHEKYIRLCLQSIVDQKTNFDFEVIVGEDCSTDGTQAIVQEFAENYPEIVKPIFHENNVGGTRNYFAVHGTAQGEYIAHIDGDDYALPGKLQKQADFLDQNRNCSFVCHRVQIVSEDGSQVVGLEPKGPHPQFTDIETLIRKYIFFNHSSKMYRRSANVIDHSLDADVIDFTLHIEHANLGLIGFLPETLGGYRMNSGGISKSKGDKLYWLFELTLDGFDRALQLGVNEEIVKYGKSRYLIGAAVFCLVRDDLIGFRKYITASRINGSYCSVAHAILFAFRRQEMVLKYIFKLRTLLLNLVRGLL